MSERRYAKYDSGLLVPANGIVFPGTQVASAGVNTLDDYEEGSWTPSCFGVTLTSAAGRYTKVGRLVAVDGVMQFPGNADGNWTTVAGLPFAAGAEAALAVGLCGLADIRLAVQSGAAYAFVWSESAAHIVNSQMNGYLTFSGVYQV